MDSKVAAALRGFIARTPAQRDEFVNVANRYIDGGPLTQQRILDESARSWGITKVDIGPASQTCPYCGK